MLAPTTAGSNRMRVLTSKWVVAASLSSNPLDVAAPGRARMRYPLPPTHSKPGGLTRRMVAHPLASRRWTARRAAVISAGWACDAND